MELRKVLGFAVILAWDDIKKVTTHLQCGWNFKMTPAKRWIT